MAFEMKKLENLALLIAGHPKVQNLGQTKLYKLIFFCDVTHLREHGESITGSEYIKYQYGPVPSRAEKALKHLKKENALEVTRKILDTTGDFEIMEIKANRIPDKSLFTKEEIATVNLIAEKLGKASASQLSDLSHKEPAWIEADMHKKLDPQLMFYGREEDSDGL